MFQSSRNGRRRAVVAVQVIIMLPVLFGLAAVTVDVGVMYNARADIQRAADAAALAAVSEFAYAEEGVAPFAAASETAAELVAANPALSRVLTLDAETDIIFGRAYYDEIANAYNFVPGDVPTNAVRVTVRHTDDSPNGALPLYFAGVLGKSVTDISATSVALFVQPCYEEGDCYDEDTAGSTIMCHYGDSDDSDDSQGEFGPADSDDSDDSDSGDSGSGDSGSGDSESGDSEADSDGGHTIIVNTNAVPLFLEKGDTLGACDYCPEGDSDDSDDSQGEFGPPDSSDSDDSDSGDSDGSFDGDSDDSDDSQGEFGPPDSDDSDDSDSGDSDGSEWGDGDDSDDSQGEFGPPDSDDSDDSDGGVGKGTICHIPPGNPGNPQTITIGLPALAAHLGHGDELGACPATDECLGSFRIFLIE